MLFYFTSLYFFLLFFQVLEEGRASFQNLEKVESTSPGSTAAASVMFYWQMIMFFLLFSFALSCVSQFTQFYQMTLDQEKSNKLRELLPTSVRASLLSPSGSGRLVLPPPTPKAYKKNSPKISRAIKKNSPSKPLNYLDEKSEQKNSRD